MLIGLARHAVFPLLVLRQASAGERGERGLFGNSVFENEEIALNPIREVEYDYYDLDNALDGREEDLYSEDFYGDYDDSFVPPPVVALPETSNPFGIDINFDDYKLSDIRNIEYEYDYEDYEVDNNAVDEEEVDALIETYFHRYDLDESGTLNTNEELQQLATNLSFKLRLPLTGEEIDRIVSSAGELSSENAWTLDQFRQWFKDEFVYLKEEDQDYRGDAAMAISMAQDININSNIIDDNAGWDDGDGD